MQLFSQVVFFLDNIWKGITYKLCTNVQNIEFGKSEHTFETTILKKTVKKISRPKLLCKKLTYFEKRGRVVKAPD